MNFKFRLTVPSVAAKLLLAVVVFASNTAQSDQLGLPIVHLNSMVFTSLAVTNTGASKNTITITIKDTDGTAIVSSSRSLKPGATWVMTTREPSFSTISTFIEGTVCVSDTLGDAFHVWGAIMTLRPTLYGGLNSDVRWTSVESC